MQRDLARSGGEPPLIVGPNRFCTSELVSLALRGVADGNVGAYTADGQPHNWDPQTDAGLLSLSEHSTGVPVCDALKTPQRPVWVLHGTDHFTTLFASEPVSNDQKSMTLYHWNGLPPAGPRMTVCEVTAPRGAVGPAPKQHSESFFKPEVGEIDDVVQADPADKAARPDEFCTWRYEVVLARDDPDVQVK